MAQILEKDERMLGRIGLDIHDGPTQQLSVALLEVQLLEADLADAEEAGGPRPSRCARPSSASTRRSAGRCTRCASSSATFARPSSRTAV